MKLVGLGTSSRIVVLVNSNESFKNSHRNGCIFLVCRMAQLIGFSLTETW